MKKERLASAITGDAYTARFVKITEGKASWWYMTTQDRLRAVRELGYDIIDVNHTAPGHSYACQITIGRENGSETHTAIGIGSCQMGDKIDAAGIAMRRAICSAVMLTGELEEAFDLLRELNGATLQPDRGDAMIEDVLMRV